MAKATIKPVKKRAWDVFSEYIRLRDADKNGYCTCITCGKRTRWNDGMQAGHGMAGRTNAILFEEKLVAAQCLACNMFKNGMPDEYHEVLLKKYGEEGYYELLRQKHSSRRFTVDELEEMISEWRDKIAEYRKEKNV